MLGLDQQVCGEQARIGRIVRDHEALGRPEQHHRRHPVALHLDLRDRDRRRPRADDLSHPRDRFGSEAERRDTGRTVDTEHATDPELATHHEHRRVDLAGAARHGRDDQGQLGHPGHDRRHSELIRDARIAGLAGRREQAGRRDRGDLLSDREAGLGFDAPVGGSFHLCFVERTEVVDRIVDRSVHRL